MEAADSPGGPMGWFVEGAFKRSFILLKASAMTVHLMYFLFDLMLSDISLTKTTLRFSKSNEVATVSNFAMSQSKIVNCNRSPSAVVLFKLKLHVKILEGDNVKNLTEALQKFVRDNPRIWETLIFIRQDYIGGISVEPGSPWTPSTLNTNNQFVIFTVCFQHRASWQSSVRIMINRGELLHYIYNVCKEMEVQYDEVAPSRSGPEFQSNPFTQTLSGQRSDVDPSKLF